MDRFIAIDGNGDIIEDVDLKSNMDRFIAVG